MLKAFLLVAGLGKRLRPVTDDIPKCLLPINGKPLLQIWLEHLSNHGIDEVLINTHRLHERIEQFIATDYPSGIRKEKAIHGAGADSTEAKNLKTGKRKKIQRIEQFIATDYPSGIRKEKAIHPDGIVTTTSFHRAGGAGADSTEAKNLKTGKRKKIQWPEIRLFYEPELLGSAGTLLSNRDWVDDGNPFSFCTGIT